jgi:hypothetical protein
MREQSYSSAVELVIYEPLKDAQRAKVDRYRQGMPHMSQMQILSSLKSTFCVPSGRESRLT